MHTIERVILYGAILYLLFLQKPNIEYLSNELEIVDVCRDEIDGYMRRNEVKEHIDELRTIVGEEYQGEWYKQGLIGSLLLKIS